MNTGWKRCPLTGSDENGGGGGGGGGGSVGCSWGRGRWWGWSSEMKL